jgi:F420 biosynthesis protein FbiB-like protein
MKMVSSLRHTKSSSECEVNAAFGTIEFWDYLDRLVKDNRIVIDRPKGSAHPRYPELVYPLDYGFLEGTTTIDRGGIDVWVGSSSSRSLDALALTVDLKKRDAEIKLLLGCTEGEKQVIIDFLNGGSMRARLVRRSDFHAELRSRRSVRRFQTKPVPQDILERILETATCAPSAHNRQPWRFVVITKMDLKTQLAGAMGVEFLKDLLDDGLSGDEAEVQVMRSRQRISGAPVVVLLCLDSAVGDTYPDAERQGAEFLMGAQGVAMAGATLLLAAHAEGLGGVWMCAPLFAPQAVRMALDLSVDWHPQGVVLLGYPPEDDNPLTKPKARHRRPLSEVALFL